MGEAGMKPALSSLSPKLKNLGLIIVAAVVSGGLTYAVIQWQGQRDNAATTRASGIEGIIGQPVCRETIATSGRSTSECYQAYLVVRTKAGSHEVARVNASNQDGNFKVELSPGEYLVNYVVTDPKVLPQEPQNIFVARGQFVQLRYDLIGQHD